MQRKSELEVQSDREHAPFLSVFLRSSLFHKLALTLAWLLLGVKKITEEQYRQPSVFVYLTSDSAILAIGT